MIKAIVFDLDGTLLNTIKDIKLSLNETFVSFGYKKLSTKTIKKNLGNGSKRLVKDSAPKNITASNLNFLTNCYYKTYESNPNNNTKPYKGIMNLLKKLKNEGYKLAICSNKMDLAVKKLNEQMFEGIFDVAIGESKKVPTKPHPLMVKIALEELGVTNNEAIYVGDSEVDYRTANNAKLTPVLVSWGFRSKSFLKELDSPFLINKPKQLINVLKELNKND